MKLSKVSKLSLLLFLFGNFGCTTSSFKILKSVDSANEISVTPDRVLLECESLDRDDGEVSDGFMIHILDDNKRVLNITQTNALDPESCNTRLKKIGTILKSGKKIYIAAMGTLKQSDETRDFKYFFPKFGTFTNTGRSLQFIAISNEHGTCYSAYSEDLKPCPPAPFPLK